MPMPYPVEAPDPTAELPSIVGLLYGVKSVIRLLCATCALYLKHKERADLYLTPEQVTALMLLASGCEALSNLNPPGPA